MGARLVAAISDDHSVVSLVSKVLPPKQGYLCSSCAHGDVPSPCVSLCTLDLSGQSCRGCGRTVDEITGWLELTPTARARILLRLRGSDSE